MPLPWKKKSRTTRISRLVADLQSPAKHGGSLVVETGFPTSLIDLFVKNRDRLRKSSKKSKQNQRLQHPDGDGNSRAASDLTTDDPRVAAAAEDHADPPASAASRDHAPGPPVDAAAGIAEPPNDRARGEELQAEGAHAVSVTTEIPNGKCLDGRRANWVTLAVLSVFLVAVLALCTKRLVTGITISALALLLLENMGMVIPRVLKSRLSGWSARGIRNSRYKRGAFVFEGTENCQFEEEEVGDGGFDFDGPVVPVECHDSDGKPKTSEPSVAVPGEEADCSGPVPDPELLTQGRRKGCLDIEEEETVAVQGNSNEGAKKKSKIMKRIMVPMKMRNQKKGERKESQSRVL